jgi:hypothetical protein
MFNIDAETVEVIDNASHRLLKKLGVEPTRANFAAVKQVLSQFYKNGVMDAKLPSWGDSDEEDYSVPVEFEFKKRGY